jgi:large subunit ribosomal protein L20
MPRVKRGVIASKRRKNLLKDAKGFKWRRKSNYRAAKEALIKAGKYAYRDRKAKKRTFRALWILRLNNALRLHDWKYSTFIKYLKDEKIALDRKILSSLAVNQPEIFERLIKKLKTK